MKNENRIVEKEEHLHSRKTKPGLKLSFAWSGSLD